MTLFRYLLREFIPPFFFSLALIIFLFILNLVFTMLGRIVGKGLPIWTVLEFFGLNLAWMIALAVPMAVLVAVLSAYGRLSADNEVTALRSSGVGPMQMIAPAIMFGVIMSLGLAYFNNYMLPDLNFRSRQLQTDIRRLKPAMVLEPGVFLSDIPGHVLYARQVNGETNEISDVMVYQDDDPRFGSTVIAADGKLKYEEWFEGFEFSLHDGEILRSDRARPGEYHRIQFDNAIFRIHAPDMSLRRTATQWRGDREMNVSQLLDKIENYEKIDAAKNSKNISRLLVEIHKKFSIPAACLIFAALGGLLGQMVRRSGIGVSAGYSMAFFLIYWVFLIAGEDLADRGTVGPGTAMWAPNVLFSLVVIFLWLRQRKSGFRLFGK
ncbi:MAG: LptF/LptG family permease [Calditrichaeota bacterium]|nr:LptF/LptG family permease [Calditrichota bacterium]MCB9366028.1 LptF/LptG family permease [Calditrichota bacterium]MCB9391846.1 LptF/LptG family permease [Calditrichota bacterium]